MPFLATLDLSHNAIEDVKDWHEKLGNIKNLNLSSNNIRDIEGMKSRHHSSAYFPGLSRLLSLETLDVSSNSLSSLAAIASMGRLPCLDVLLLRANPIRKMVDYRTKVLEVFGRRAAEVLVNVFSQLSILGETRQPPSRFKRNGYDQCALGTATSKRRTRRTIAIASAQHRRTNKARTMYGLKTSNFRYISGGPLDSEAKSL